MEEKGPKKLQNWDWDLDLLDSDKQSNVPTCFDHDGKNGEHNPGVWSLESGVGRVEGTTTTGLGKFNKFSTA